AAIELIDTIDAQRVPAAKALKEWGTAHRYAGSGDRAAISGLIWDVLRRRASSAWLMDADTPRARVLGMLRLERDMNTEAIAALCDGGRFAPEPLSAAERSALSSRTLDDAPPHVAGDYPEWLDAQLAALFSAAKPGEQVIDLCAGAGGKTLALAAMMGGKGRLIATDHDKRQLAPIYERLSRAGVHNADVRAPKGDTDPLADIKASADLVLIDAPCTGTGTWRRNPDAKWRMRPGALEVRLKDQAEVLDRASALVKPGGRIAYVTCSVLPSENGD